MRSVATAAEIRASKKALFKRMFLENVTGQFAAKNTKIITAATKQRIIETLASWGDLEHDGRKSKYQYQRKYALLRIGQDEPQLYLKNQAESFTNKKGQLILDKVRKVVKQEEVFEVLYAAHLAIGHGRLRKMMA